MDQTHHIVFLPSPGMGHFLPVLELAKRLVIHHHFTATILIFPDLVPKWSAQEPFLESLPTGLDYLILPPPDFSGFPTDMMPLHVLGVFSVTCSITSIRKIMADLSSKLNIVAIVVDLFATDAFDIAKEFEIPSYLFYTTTAMALSLSLALPELDQSCTCEYRDLPDSIQLQGCIPIPGKDVMEPIQNRQSISYKFFLNSVESYRKADGIIVNTFQELECGALNGLQEEDFKPLIYPVGPIVQSNSANHDSAKESILSNWLDSQPSESVLYVSFGSHWTLSQAQMHELAHGLETSDTRFLWVIRRPKDNQVGIDSSENDDPLTCLPEGFIERTKDRGLMVPYWALQQTVLGHESTGGFLTHCGWNSVLESLTNGVPMIAWPLGAEQNMNALLLTEGVKVAIQVKGRAEDGVVGRDEIANIVKNLMEGGEEGKQVRDRARELKLAAKMALREGGSSFKSLADLVSKWYTKV